MPAKRTPPNRPKSGKGKPKKQPRSKGSAKKQIVDQAALDLQALTLRRDGNSFPEIAEEMGCSLSTAKARVTRKLNEIHKYTRETAEQIKTMMDMRLLRTDLEMSGIIANGTNSEKIRAATAQVAIHARRSALLGLDASAKVDLNISGAANRNIDDEIQRVLDSVETASTAGEIPAVVEVDGTVEPNPTNGRVANLGVPGGEGNGKD